VTIPGIRVAADDAMELTELLGLLVDRIDRIDSDRLPASLRRFNGNNAYDTTALRTDLTRFQFLLGGDEQSYFGTSDL
jgi:hypothetical protein